MSDVAKRGMPSLGIAESLGCAYREGNICLLVLGTLVPNVDLGLLHIDPSAKSS